jgi:two-component system, OmpR family, response regulator CpxR
VKAVRFSKQITLPHPHASGAPGALPLTLPKLVCGKIPKVLNVVVRAPSSLLVIDDDPGLCSLIQEFFSAYNFRVQSANDGGSGLAEALRQRYDLVLLDVMLPVLDGFEVLKHIRRRSAVPVIMLTARTNQQDRIAGLNAGADDYLPKPFGPHELLARVRAVLRRTVRSDAATPPILRSGDLTLNVETREVNDRGKRVPLTSVEFDILDVLMRSAGRIVSRDKLAAVLYNRESTPYERAIDVHISHLRKKLDSKGDALIRSVRGVGYLFVPSGRTN